MTGAMVPGAMVPAHPGPDHEAYASRQKPWVMGVLNVTPDSFSDGGQHSSVEAALEHARTLIAQGAHIIDVGGESTRPGADRITPAEEQRRVLPIIEALAAEGITVSIDTVNAKTASLAVAAGASIINDVSGGTADPEMLRMAAATEATFVIMHWRGIPDPRHSRSDYTDVVEEVRAELALLVEAATAQGIKPANIVVDPGLGFDKTTLQGWQLLAGLDRLTSLGHPVLIGASRKRMLGETLGEGSTMADRDLATAVISALSARAGVWGVRVHDVHTTTTALAVAEAWGHACEPAGHACEPASHSKNSSSSNQMATNGCLSETEAAPTAHLRGSSSAADAAGGAAVDGAVGSVAIDADAAGGAADGAAIDGVAIDADADADADAAARDAAAGGAANDVVSNHDRITLTGLEVFAHHGVFEFEREQGQRFIIDAQVAVDLRPAASGDNLARTVNYAELAGAILAAASNDPVDLIETLAERIAIVALSFDGVKETTITVHKPEAPIDAQFADVSVTITRQSKALP